MPNTHSKKAVNLSVNAVLLQEAKAHNVDLSQAAEHGIITALAQSKAEKWKRENAEAIQSFNAYIEKNGVPLAEYRQF